MAHDLHIERPDGLLIPLSEWRAAVEATEGVRLFTADRHTMTIPDTGQVVNTRAREGDAEVFFRDSGEWRFVFRWFEGAAAFKPRFELTETAHPVWRAAVALATRLGAVIRGDEGESYDFHTGEMIDG
jgi:hypothetical protein